MVKPRYPYVNDKGREFFDLIQHYSDLGLVLKQVETGEHYSDPVDSYPCRYTYIETDTPIEKKEEEKAE